MNRQGAALALEKIAAGEAQKAGQVAEWLQSQEGIGGLYVTEDLVYAVTDVASSLAGTDPSEAAAAVDSLVCDLCERPATRVFAVFEHVVCTELVTRGPITLGPVGEVDEQFGLTGGLADADGVLDGAAFVVMAEVPARERLGLVHGARWLRGALGALYFLARRAGARPSLGRVHAGVPGGRVFAGAEDDYQHVSYRFRLTTGDDLNIDHLLGLEDGMDFFLDCLSVEPTDLVAERLTQCAPWFQFGLDAAAYPDAALALGIALEALVGNETGGSVVDVVSKRCGYLLQTGDDEKARALSGLDWKRKASKCYDQRSSVAHGRYVESPKQLAREPQLRDAFEDLVSRVAFRFRERGRDEGWATFKDMKDWAELLEMSG